MATILQIANTFLHQTQNNSIKAQSGVFHLRDHNANTSSAILTSKNRQHMDA